MKRFWLSLAVVAGLGVNVALAQITVSPTGGTEDVNVSDTAAVVTQSVHVNIPQALALHIGATSLEFDMTNLKNNTGTGDWACVYGKTGDGSLVQDTTVYKGDYKLDLSSFGEAFWGQTQYEPLGTSYDLTATSWPGITINGGGLVQNYPAFTLTSGAVETGTKNYFVCYRTFELQTFSNTDQFDLQVKRIDPTSLAAGQKVYPEPVYVQGNNYCTATAAGHDAWTGLYGLMDSDMAHLIPATTFAAQGTSGEKSLQCGPTDVASSWLKNVIVVAIKVDGEHFGDNFTNLEYKLVDPGSAYTLSNVP